MWLAQECRRGFISDGECKGLDKQIIYNLVYYLLNKQIWYDTISSPLTLVLFNSPAWLIKSTNGWIFGIFSLSISQFEPSLLGCHSYWSLIVPILFIVSNSMNIEKMILWAVRNEMQIVQNYAIKKYYTRGNETRNNMITSVSFLPVLCVNESLAKRMCGGSCFIWRVNLP